MCGIQWQAKDRSKENRKPLTGEEKLATVF
jgi:hypothetical protein